MINGNYAFLILPNSYIIYFFSFWSGRARELEEKRINKEMANIRSKFKGLYYIHTAWHAHFPGDTHGGNVVLDYFHSFVGERK